MLVMYIGWPANVNNWILDSSSVSIGADAVVEDNMASGRKNSRLKNSNIPDVFNVAMDFNWVIKDENGLTEKDRFYEWYKYKHCFGQNPVEFPKIILGMESTKKENAFYKITAGANGTKNGDEERLQMVFTEVYTGVINIPDEVYEIDHITGSNKSVDVVFTDFPDTAPLTADFSVTLVKNGTVTPITISEFIFDNNLTDTLVFSEPLTAGIYKISVTYKGITKSDEFEVV